MSHRNFCPCTKNITSSPEFRFILSLTYLGITTCHFVHIVAVPHIFISFGPIKYRLVLKDFKSMKEYTSIAEYTFLYLKSNFFIKLFYFGYYFGFKIRFNFFIITFNFSRNFF